MNFNEWIDPNRSAIDKPWTKVSDQLPAPGINVLAYYVNRHGNRRIVRRDRDALDADAGISGGEAVTRLEGALRDALDDLRIAEDYAKQTDLNYVAEDIEIIIQKIEALLENEE
jgi:hypothetical protein